MASYWIVVPKGNTELFGLLVVAFRGRTDFIVIVDRRGADPVPAAVDRRGRGPDPGPDEFVVAECADAVEHPLTGVGRSTPVRTGKRGAGRAGRSGSRPVGIREPLAAGR
jgi:hypothetical protein